VKLRRLTLGLVMVSLPALGDVATPTAPNDSSGAWASSTVWDEVLFGVWGSSDTNIYAVGVDAILRSRDDGHTWKRERTRFTGVLLAVWGADERHVWAVGDRGEILYSTGNGSWHRQESQTREDLYGIWGSGPDDVFVVGGGGVILHSSDGTTWQKQHLPGRRKVSDVSGIGRGRAIVVASDGLIAMQRGSGWEEVAQLPGDLIAIGGDGKGTLWVTGSQGRVYRSSDEGRTWTGEVVPTQFDLRHVWWDGRTAHVVAAYTLWERTKDGWRKEATAPYCLAQLWGTGPSDLFAVGWWGTLLHRR
jgi:photosystem II stability/assembly factor-like uncharacterized protein